MKDKPESQPQPIQTHGWAVLYSRFGTGFGISVAPKIRSLYEATEIGKTNRHLLDVCCGQGNLMKHFLDHGYTTSGIDLSEHQLDFARRNLGSYLSEGRARLIHADAASFSVDGEFGLATSTFDALNMLQGVEALKGCLRCVRNSVVEGGLFVFDLMTQRGFWLDYNGSGVRDTPDELRHWNSVYDGGEKATTRGTGFVKSEDGTWERFEEFRTPTYFSPTVVIAALEETGWSNVVVTDTEDLTRPIEDPVQVDRVFYVAS